MGIGGGSGGDICYWNNYVLQIGSGNVSAFQVNSTSASYLGSFNSTFTGQVNGIAVKDSVFYVSTVNNLHVLKLGYEIMTGINEGFIENFNVYPNPLVDEVTIELINTGNEAKITITDFSGREIMTTHCLGNSTTLDMTAEIPGIYFVTIEQKNLKAQKIIIKE